MWICKKNDGWLRQLSKRYFYLISLNMTSLSFHHIYIQNIYNIYIIYIMYIIYKHNIYTHIHIYIYIYIYIHIQWPQWQEAFVMVILFQDWYWVLTQHDCGWMCSNATAFKESFTKVTSNPNVLYILFFSIVIQHSF